MKITVSRLLLLILFVFILPVQSLHSQLMQASNLDFEDGEPGFMPRGWKLPSYAAARQYKAFMTSLNPKSGNYCLELNRSGEFKDSIYGSVMQSIDAKPYRGRRIKFGAWVRAEIHSPVGSAHLWLIEYDGEDNITSYDLMEDRPIVLNNWNYYEIVIDIEPTASYINYGLMLKGNGKAWIDAAVFDIVEDTESEISPPKKLTQREIENLYALASLFGFAKYYNPSTEARNIDFDKFLLNAIPKIEKAKNDDELIVLLNDIFRPVYPAMKIYKQTLPPEQYYYTGKPDSALDKLALARIHIGSPVMPQGDLAVSRVVNVFNSLRRSEGAVVQVLNAENLRGKTVVFSIYAKQEAIKPNGRVELRIGAEDKDETKEYILNNLEITEVIGRKWKRYEMELKVPDDAVALRIGLVLSGDGRALFDNAKLTIKGTNKPVEDFRNPDFELGHPNQKIAYGWRIVKSAERAGYSAVINTSDKKKGKNALEISSEKRNRIPLPKPGNILLGTVNENIGFSMPYCLFADEKGTLPHAAGKPNIPDDIYFVPDGKDRISRLAVFINAWNVFKHFALFTKDNEIWDKIFAELLYKTSLDKDNKEFIMTLEALVKHLDDSQARVWLSDVNYYYGLPFLMRWTDGKLIVTNVHHSYKEVQRGDVVIAVDGIPAEQYLENAAKYISGANKNRIYLSAVARLRAGEQNSVVNMTFMSAEGKKRTLDVPRNTLLNALSEKRPEFAVELMPGIFYVDLTRIDDKLFYQMIDSLRYAKSIIFDLRGTTIISEHFLSFFLSEPIKSVNWQLPVFSTPDYKPDAYKTIQGEIKVRATLAGKKLVFLQNERTVGYAEAIISLVKENSLGEIAGRRTGGTAGELTAFRIAADYGFTWTSVKAVDAKGKDIYGKGIEPTISAKELTNSKDELMKLVRDILD